MKEPIQNALILVRLDIAEEFCIDKNYPYTPSSLSYGSTKKCWWVCKNGHEYEATVNNRTSGYGCPFCSGKKVILGLTDLRTTHPRIAAEWHPFKNYPLSPDCVSYGSKKKVWWRCEMGHEWQAVIYSRNDGNDCPYCSKRLKTSFPEQAIFYFISKEYPDAINSYQSPFLGKMELDIFIPSISTGIEYDGALWHSSKVNIERDLKKYIICKSQIAPRW